MVLAEIPLWMTHGNEAGKSASSTTEPAAASNNRSMLESAHAMQSLGLWRKDRAAIYAVHVHPHQPVVCTGGGDGTVRLWSTTTLFAQQHLGGRFVQKSPQGDETQQQAANSNKTGYVSTSSSSDGGAGSSDDDEKASEASCLDRTMMDDKNDTPVIHDLSNVVRSRKHPEHASPERPNPNAAALSSAQSPAGAAAAAGHPSSHHHHQQRLLCTLSAHTGSSVLAVRFSSTGKLLASAGDDGCVCLYAPDATTLHQWHRILLCRGHNLDAVGLAWSPDDSYLVSVSLDRETPILVWKVADVVSSGQAPTGGSMIRSPFKVLGRTEHTSTVKGVCFDPVGSYICTSGDDPAVCIWRTHGDWGLEKRIDAKDGIFRQWGSNAGGGVPLSSQSLFRRLSWSTDGMHILTTNATNKNKHVASTVSREQWAFAGSASLVGHKQPVVVAQHAPVLLAVSSSSGHNGSKSNDPDEEPDYATLVALGDKKGFVTIWSTRKSRPLFKLQCSEGRCTVTDMAWGVADDHLLLSVALLDGHVVMLRLGFPDELGPILPKADQAKLFRLRYGIDTNDPASYGRLMDDTRPKLIETALQMTLEEDHEEDEDMDDDDSAPPPAPAANQLVVRSKKDGKKRIQPLPVTQPHKPMSPPPAKRAKTTKPPPTDALKNAKQIADKAAASAKATTTATTKAAPSDTTPAPSPPRMPPPPTPFLAAPASTAASLSYSTERVHSVQLAVKASLLSEEEARWTAECHNRPGQVPLGSKGPGMPCVDISLQREGKPVWHDQIVGTSCSAMAGNENVFAVGMADGSIQLFGASPLTGWRGETAVRAFPPIVLGQAIVTLQIKSWEGSPCLLVVTADGGFGVYRLEPTLAKVLRGSILPAMTHMANASLQEEKILPKLSRCQLTDKGQILLLLSSSGTSGSSSAAPAEPRGRSTSHGGDLHSSTVGGSIQGFVYHREMELWLRISDCRFVLSDFYSSLPLRKSAREQGPLHQLDDAVRLGAMESAVKPSHRKRQDYSTTGSSMLTSATDGGNFVPTKAHCEDRLACAVALKSSTEFRQWLGLYAKTLAASGQETLLRTLVDALLGAADDGGWWLCAGLDSMELDRKDLLKKVVMPAMSKNRALQRSVAELAVELDS